MIVIDLNAEITEKSIELNDFYRLNNIPSVDFPNGWVNDDAEETYFAKLRYIQGLMRKRTKKISLIEKSKKIGVFENLTKYREIAVTSSTYERTKKRVHNEFKQWRLGR